MMTRGAGPMAFLFLLSTPSNDRRGGPGRRALPPPDAGHSRILKFVCTVAVWQGLHQEQGHQCPRRRSFTWCWRSPPRRRRAWRRCRRAPPHAEPRAHAADPARAHAIPGCSLDRGAAAGCSAITPCEISTAGGRSGGGASIVARRRRNCVGSLRLPQHPRLRRPPADCLMRSSR